MSRTLAAIAIAHTFAGLACTDVHARPQDVEAGQAVAAARAATPDAKKATPAAPGRHEPIAVGPRDGADATWIPVRVGPGAGLGTKTDIDAALRAPTEDWHVLVGKGQQKVKLRSCVDYLAIEREQVDTENPIDQRALLYIEARCQALRMLRDARPSARSFLNALKVDRTAPNLLPAEFYLDLSPDEERLVQAAARGGRTWRSIDPKVRGRLNPDGEWEFQGSGYQVQLIEFARADFDHDGVEDILIVRTGFPTGASMTDYTVFLVSRASDAAPLKVLKTWRQAF